LVYSSAITMMHGPMSISSISVNIRNYIDVHMNFFLTITDTITFQY